LSFFVFENDVVLALTVVESLAAMKAIFSSARRATVGAPSRAKKKSFCAKSLQRKAGMAP
jgi:hypothetical protein